jgi:hypothetical protein
MPKCLICDNVVDPDDDKYGPSVKKPTYAGIKTILEYSKLRDDNIFRRLNSIQDELLTNPQNYTYHSSCRKKYCSKININTVQKASNDMSRYECGRTLRDGQPKFEIKNQCFICGSSGTVKKKP